MEFTGERVIPGQVDVDLWNEHLARYAFAARVALDTLNLRQLAAVETAALSALESAGEAGAAGEAPAARLRILDAGCGSGYGAAYLASLGPSFDVVGIDNNYAALEYARQNYSAENLSFVRGDCLAMEFAECEFDMVVALEVIEHLSDPSAFLKEAARVLAPAGRLVVSTPNRRYYSEERGYANPFHAREYDANEFDALLEQFFAERAFFVQNHTAAVTFYPRKAGIPENSPGEGASVEFDAPPAAEDQAHFLVGICSSRSLAFAAPFVFVPSAGNVLREREHHIRKVEQDLGALQEATQRELEERKRWAEWQQVELAERDQTIRRQQAEHEEAVAWARGLEAELAEARRILDERQQELEKSNEWARSLDRERERLAGIAAELSEIAAARHADIEAKVAWARSLEADVAAAREAQAKLQSEFEERTAWALRLQAEREQWEAQAAERTAWAQKVDIELEADRADLRLIFGSLWYRVGKNLRLSPVPASDRKDEPKPPDGAEAKSAGASDDKTVDKADARNGDKPDADIAGGSA